MVLVSLRCKNNVVHSLVMVRRKNTRMTTAMVTMVTLVRETSSGAQKTTVLKSRDTQRDTQKGYP